MAFIELRAAAQQALEALRPFVRGNWTPGLAAQAAAAMDRLEAALAEPVQDQALQWGAAPVRIDLGSNPNGWREAFLPLGKDNTLRLLAETEALPFVENALRAALAEPVQEPAPMPPFPPVSLWKRGCAVCGIGAGGHAYGYACPRSDCPTRVTCGGQR